MRVLALETSGSAGTVAALSDQQLLAERPCAEGQRSAQALAPAIHALLQQVDWRPADLQLIAVTSGPGSFTGLRVGVTTAKTLAYATGAALVAVNTLDVCATAMIDRHLEVVPPTRLLAVMDAQRGEFFAADYLCVGEQPIRPCRTTRIEDPQSLKQQIDAGCLLTGPAARKLLKCLALDPDELRGEGRLADEPRTGPSAESVGRLGYLQAIAGQTIDPFALVPEYYRASAAEEKRRRNATGR